MARTQAADYDQRRAAIVETAAQLWAERGFLGASVADLARACNTSKSLIYHYYPSTRDILFEAMDSHVRELLETASTVIAQPGEPAQRLGRLTQAFVAIYATAGAHQTVLLNELDQLSPEQRATVVKTQRELVQLVQTLLSQIRPDLKGGPIDHATTMLFFGMINWLHTWYDPKGTLSPEAIANLATSLFLGGLMQART